jgi:hypothetical protein
MPAEMLPDDGTVIFAETCDWFGTALESTFESSPTGGRRKRPAELFVLPLLAVELQLFSRNWDAPDSPPAWSTDPADMGRISNPWLTQLATIDDFFAPFTRYSQTKWRLAWSPHLAAGDGLPAGAFRPHGGKWNWVRVRYQEAFFVGSGPYDYSSPDSATGALTKKWQMGIDALPAIFNPDLPYTWPGTDWTEATIPAAEPGGSGINMLYPLIPQIGVVLSSAGNYFHPDTDAAGVLPGGKRSRVWQIYPQFNDKTLV